jgi:ankyrin repeat protein
MMIIYILFLFDVSSLFDFSFLISFPTSSEMEQFRQEQLFDLIKAGDLVGLKTRLVDIESNGQSPSEVLTSTRDDKGMTMFLVACGQGHLEIVEFLLEHGSMIGELCESSSSMVRGQTGLHYAAERGHLHVMSRLVELGASVNKKDWYGRAPLHAASFKGHLTVINRIVELGGSVNEKDNSGWTPLHHASRHGHLSVLNRLAELGASVNEKENEGWQPLHLASRFGHFDVIDRLIELGASVSEKDIYGRTPLHHASTKGHLNVVMYLLRHNAISLEGFDDKTVIELLTSEETLLAVLSYGFNQPVSEDDLQRPWNDMRDLYRRLRVMCPLQVRLDSFFFE